MSLRYRRLILIALAGSEAIRQLAVKGQWTGPVVELEAYLAGTGTDDLREVEAVLSLLPVGMRAPTHKRLSREVARWMLRPPVWRAVEGVASLLIHYQPKLRGPLARGVINKFLGRRVAIRSRNAIALLLRTFDEAEGR